ncbi:c-type cytochrome [Roseixanthobacter liquoris]|uniref:c-type cytochrome n=1 Tax=Roseixanthobacter liquoris TaxID=3119921 RepID=UPI003728A359
MPLARLSLLRALAPLAPLLALAIAHAAPARAEEAGAGPSAASPSATGTAAPAPAADGEQVFRTRCGSCHSLEAGQNRIGPSLAGVYGRAAGKVEGARYSPGMHAAAVTWDDASLEAYLANPRDVVPGSTMTFALRDAAQRQAVIAYLRAQQPAKPQ